MAEMEEMKSQVRTMKGEIEEGRISMEGRMQKMIIEEGKHHYDQRGRETSL